MGNRLHVYFENEPDIRYYLHSGSTREVFDKVKEYTQKFTDNHYNKEEYIAKLRTLRSETQILYNEWEQSTLDGPKVWDKDIHKGFIIRYNEDDKGLTTDENSLMIPKVGNKVIVLGPAFKSSYNGVILGYRGRVDHVYFDCDTCVYIKTY